MENKFEYDVGLSFAGEDMVHTMTHLKLVCGMGAVVTFCSCGGLSNNSSLLMARKNKDVVGLLAVVSRIVTNVKARTIIHAHTIRAWTFIGPY